MYLKMIGAIEEKGKKMNKNLTKEVKAMEDILIWLAEEVLDDENWELNSYALGEVICRKLKKIGLTDVIDDYWYMSAFYERTSAKMEKVED